MATPRTVSIARLVAPVIWVLVLASAAAGLASGCSSGADGARAGGPAVARPDAPTGDASVERWPDGDVGASVDAGTDGTPDADAGPDPSAIVGTISGACGTLAPLLHTPTPSLVDNALVFVPGERYDRSGLSPGGQTIFDEPNAGGSSVESEAMSFEVLHYCEGASLLKTETQVSYSADAAAGSITDILVSIGGERFGVSVTRAYKPSPGMSDDEVKSLLEKKLRGILSSSARVAPADAWVKQILHVFAVGPSGAAAVKRVWPTIVDADKADTIVLVTATVGGGFIYCNPDPPLGSECPM